MENGGPQRTQKEKLYVHCTGRDRRGCSAQTSIPEGRRNLRRLLHSSRDRRIAVVQPTLFVPIADTIRTSSVSGQHGVFQSSHDWRNRDSRGTAVGPDSASSTQGRSRNRRLRTGRGGR